MTENGSATMSKPIVNGDSPHSQTLDHVTSYPLVADLVQFYQRNSVGAKSIEASHSLYRTFFEPLTPWLQTPYSVAYPYLQRADSFGDSSLDTIDNHFPALKSTNFEKLRGNAVNVARYPFDVMGSTRDYVLNTYEDESKAVGGQGVVAFSKSVISTELRIATEALQACREVFLSKKNELEDKYEKMKKDGSGKAYRAKKTAQHKVDHVADSH